MLWMKKDTDNSRKYTKWAMTVALILSLGQLSTLLMLIGSNSGVSNPYAN